MKVSGKFDRDEKSPDERTTSTVTTAATTASTSKVSAKKPSRRSTSVRKGQCPTMSSPAVSTPAVKSATAKRAPKKSSALTSSVSDSSPVSAEVASKTQSNTSTELEIEGQDWIEIFPSGVSVATAMGRPVLILKDPNSGDVLPVWMQPLDAGVAMAELSHTMGSTPHAVTRQLLAMMKFKVRSCTFIELIGHHQYALIEISKLSDQPLDCETLHLRVRADEAMSFCLQASAKFFSTKDFMARCRDLDVDLAKLESNLVEGALPALQAEIEISSKKHPYVM